MVEFRLCRYSMILSRSIHNDLFFVDGVDEEIINDQDIWLNKALVRTSYIIRQWPLMNIVLWQN